MVINEDRLEFRIFTDSIVCNLHLQVSKKDEALHSINDYTVVSHETQTNDCSCEIDL